MRKPRKSSREIIEILPAVAVSVSVGVAYCIVSLGQPRDSRDSAPQIQMGGFIGEDLSGEPSFRRLEKRREGRRSQCERYVRLPSPSSVAAAADPEPLYPNRSLTEIPNLWEQFESSSGSWEFLSKKIRGKITAPKPTEKWREVVLHHSNSPGGNAAMFDMYHRRVRGIEGGLAYHFVVGNGTYSGDGAIEVSGRWAEQGAAGVLPGEEPKGGAISICLVGDYGAKPPTQNQLAALSELVAFLRARFGHLTTSAHVQSGQGLKNCPGRYFPRDFVLEQLNGR